MQILHSNLIITQKNGWVSLLRQHSNVRVRQLIEWWRCEASGTIQSIESIVSMTARRRRQRFAPPKARTECLVPTHF